MVGWGKSKMHVGMLMWLLAMLMWLLAMLTLL